MLHIPRPAGFIAVIAFAVAYALSLTPAFAQTFPLEIDHTFGTTIIEEKPERIATLDYAGADDLLALEVQPVAIRYWYGDYPRSVWPWAEPLLEDDPVVLRGDLDFEAVAASNPDVIIALWSGITEEDYEKLSLIAPVVAVPEGVGDFALPWDERALLTGRAIGREAQAKKAIQGIHDKLAAAAKAHPDWNGKTVAVAHAWSGPASPGAYTSSDVRPQLLAQLGFRTPESIDSRSKDGSEFVVWLSPEDLSPIDADLLIWLTTSTWDNVLGIAARPFLAATQDGREVFVGPEITGAFSHASLLSLPHAIDKLVPMIEVALDGDPATFADDRPEGL